MSGKRALFVTYHFPPSLSPGSLRMASFARRLSRQGWAITVITTDPGAGDETDADVPGGETIRIERTVTLELRRYIRSAGAERAGGRGVSQGGVDSRIAVGFRRLLRAPIVVLYRLMRFPDKRAGWQCPLLLRALRVIRRDGIGVVMTSSPPHSSQLPFALLKPWFRFGWVADFRDPWTAPARQRRGWLTRFLRRQLESWVLRTSDVVVANTEGNREELLASFRFLTPDKVVVVTNGYEPDQAIDERSELSDAGEADLVYVGEVYTGMLETYLRAARFLREDGRPVPVLHVYGIFDERERRAVDDAGLGEFVVHKGVVSWGQSLRVMGDARALLLLLPQHERWRTCVPSKLYPYLYSGRPVFAIVPDGDAAAILRRARAGDAVTDRDPRAVADAMARFLDRVRRGETDAGRDAEAISEFSMETLSAKVDELLTRALERGHG